MSSLPDQLLLPISLLQASFPTVSLKESLWTLAAFVLPLVSVPGPLLSSPALLPPPPPCPSLNREWGLLPFFPALSRSLPGQA